MGMFGTTTGEVFQCGLENSGDCQTEHDNAETNGDFTPFCERCRGPHQETGEQPLWTRCKLCCSKCLNVDSDYECGETASEDCQTEHANAKANGDFTPFCDRCAGPFQESGELPLRTRCPLCCSTCSGRKEL